MIDTFDIDFSDLPLILKACAQGVVDEIVRRIYQRKRPDGSRQRDNKVSTILQKGHDHPLIGKGAYPVLANPATYEMTVSGNQVIIGIKEIREAIAGYVTDRGFEFFGISTEAEKAAMQLFDSYIVGKIKNMFRGNGNRPPASANYGLRPVR